MKNYGFISDVIEEEDYILGGGQLGGEVLTNGQWDDYLPVKELQSKRGLETMNCVAFSTLNALEILHKRKFGEEKNWSERYIGVLAGTTRNGNSPHKVIQVIRNTAGLIKDELLPFNVGIWEEYYSPSPMTEKYLKIGRKFLENWKIGHEWVFRGSGNNQEKIKIALQYSPVGASVFAWKQRNGLYYKDEGKDNHWITIYGYEDGKYWKIFDSYNDTHKQLEWQYPFGFAKRYTLDKRTKKENWVIELTRSLWRFFVDLIILIPDFFQGKPLGGRSSQWRTVRREYLKLHPYCEISGKTKRIEVHHKLPVHLFPKMELSLENLITLNKKYHLVFGHLGNYRSYNPDIAKDAPIWYDKINNRL